MSAGSGAAVVVVRIVVVGAGVVGAMVESDVSGGVGVEGTSVGGATDDVGSIGPVSTVWGKKGTSGTNVVAVGSVDVGPAGSDDVSSTTRVDGEGRASNAARSVVSRFALPPETSPADPSPARTPNTEVTTRRTKTVVRRGTQLSVDKASVTGASVTGASSTDPTSCRVASNPPASGCRPRRYHVPCRRTVR